MSSAAARAYVPVPLSHIQVDGAGVAWIDDTNVKVIEVVLDRLAHGWSAEEIHFQHPGLSLAQIYAALAWYHDHQDALDADIEARLRSVEVEMTGAGESPLMRRLRLQGRLA